MEYGPSLPANQNYTVPIGPELPPGMVVEIEPKLPEVVAKEEKVLCILFYVLAFVLFDQHQHSSSGSLEWWSLMVATNDFFYFLNLCSDANTK